MSETLDTDSRPDSTYSPDELEKRLRAQHELEAIIHKPGDRFLLGKGRIKIMDANDDTFMVVNIDENDQPIGPQFPATREELNDAIKEPDNA